MSLREKYGERDLTYSRWHRPPNLPEDISYIDIDSCEYCDRCKAPLALVELVIDVGQKFKNTTVTTHLARLANIPAWLVFYKKSEDVNDRLIDSMRVMQTFPNQTELVMISPEQWKSRLIKLHKEHICKLSPY